MVKHLDRKELRKPDEFVSFWTRVAEMLAARRRGAAIAAAVFVGTVAVSMVWAAWRESRSVAAAKAFERIQRVANAELLPAQGEAPTFDDGVPHFKTAGERLEAAVKEADAFLAGHGGAALADEARLLKAAFLLDQNRPDQAAAIYGQLLPSASLDRDLRFLAHEGMAYAHEAKGDLTKAAEAFSRLADEAAGRGGFYRDRALFHRARLAERQGKSKDAEQIYREILEKTPATSLRDEIANRLAALEAK